MKWYTFEEVKKSGKPYFDYYQYPELEDENHFYVPNFICEPFGINKEPDAFNFIWDKGRAKQRYFALYNVKDQVPYFNYKDAKENGFWTGYDAEMIGIFQENNYSPVIGYTINENGREQDHLEAYQLLYDISGTREYKIYAIQQPFLPAEERI